MTTSPKFCAGPNPPSRPRYNLPSNSADCHVHVVGPFDKYPLAEKRAYTPPESPLSDLVDYLDTSGIDRVVIVHATAAGDTPAVTLDAVAELGDRARAVVMPDSSVTGEQIRAWHTAGARAARITGFGGVPLSPEKVRNIANKIAPYGWHLLYFTTGADEWQHLLPTLLDLPVEVCVEHMGGRIFDFNADLNQENFQTLLRHVGDGQLWSKISGYYRYSDDQAYPWDKSTKFAKALVEANPERLIWGSDWPYPVLYDKPMHETAEPIDWWEHLALNNEDRNRILVRNPAKLYGFGSIT